MKNKSSISLDKFTQGRKSNLAKRKKEEKTRRAILYKKYKRELKQMGYDPNAPNTTSDSNNPTTDDTTNDKGEEDQVDHSQLIASSEPKLPKPQGIKKKRKKGGGKDPYAKAKAIWEEKKKELERIQKEKEARLKELKKKEAERKRKAKLHMMKGKTGQPVMKHKILGLVEKVMKTVGNQS